MNRSFIYRLATPEEMEALYQYLEEEEVFAIRKDIKGPKAVDIEE